MTEIAEILPGLLHWTALHPRIKQPVHSYYVADAATVLDPMVPEGVLAAIESRRTPERVALTNRHHYRQSDRIVSECGCPVLCPEPGLHEFEGGPDVRGYAFGDELAPGLTAHEVGSICPDDAALHIQVGPGALAFADGLVRRGEQLGFVSDFLMGDDPEAVKRGLVESLSRLLELDFDCLLFAHGDPLVGEGKTALHEFVESARSEAS